MKALINGIAIDGTPKEFAELLSNTSVAAKIKPLATAQQTAVQKDNQKRQQKRVHRRSWSSDDEATLRTMLLASKSVKNIARTLNRTNKAVRARMQILHLHVVPKTV